MRFDPCATSSSNKSEFRRFFLKNFVLLCPTVVGLTEQEQLNLVIKYGAEDLFREELEEEQQQQHENEAAGADTEKVQSRPPVLCTLSRFGNSLGLCYFWLNALLHSLEGSAPKRSSTQPITV